MRKTSFIEVTLIKAEARPGSHVYLAVREATILALEEEIPVVITHNAKGRYIDPQALLEQILSADSGKDKP